MIQMEISQTMTNQMKAPLGELSHGAVCLIFVDRIKFQVCS